MRKKYKIIFGLLLLSGVFALFAPLGNSAKADSEVGNLRNPGDYFYASTTLNLVKGGGPYSVSAGEDFNIDFIEIGTTTCVGTCGGPGVAVKITIFDTDDNIIATSQNIDPGDGGCSDSSCPIAWFNHERIPKDFKLQTNYTAGGPWNYTLKGVYIATPQTPAFVYPYDGQTLTDFDYWLINMASATESGDVYINSGFTSSSLVSQDHGDFRIGVSPNIIFPVSKLITFPVSTTTDWYAQAIFVSKANIPSSTPGGDILGITPVIHFTIDPTHNFTPTSITNAAGAHSPLSAFQANLPLSGGQLFQINSCEDYPLFASGTISSIRCHIVEGLKEIMNSIGSGVANTFNAVGAQVKKLFPVSIFYHINNDISQARAAASSTPALTVPYFNTPLISTTTPDQWTSDYDFDYRTFFDAIIWFIVALLMFAEGWLIIHHLRTENKGANIK